MIDLIDYCKELLSHLWNIFIFPLIDAFPSFLFVYLPFFSIYRLSTTNVI